MTLLILYMHQIWWLPSTVFQFHKGTIRTSHALPTDTPSSHFNSIKVRLERAAVGDGQRGGRFQFHKGTIRTKPRSWPTATLLNFNSIKVRLELCRSNSMQDITIYFNSIKVRLEQCSTASEAYIQPFQFHKGTIRTEGAHLLWMPCAYFNSIKVRLELASVTASSTRTTISIP